jgi:hypothetical protein
MQYLSFSKGACLQQGLLSHAPRPKYFHTDVLEALAFKQNSAVNISLSPVVKNLCEHIRAFTKGPEEKFVPILNSGE